MIEDDVQKASRDILKTHPHLQASIEACLAEDAGEEAATSEREKPAGSAAVSGEALAAASASLAEVVPGLSPEKRRQLLEKAQGDVLKAANWALEELDTTKRNAQEEDEFQVVARNPRPSASSEQEPSASPASAGQQPEATPPTVSDWQPVAAAPRAKAAKATPVKDSAAEGAKPKAKAADADGPKAKVGKAASSKAKAGKAAAQRTVQPKAALPKAGAAAQPPSEVSASTAQAAFGEELTPEESEACDVLAMVAPGSTKAQRLRLLRAMDGDLSSAINAAGTLSAEGNGGVSDDVITLVEEGGSVESAVQALSQPEAAPAVVPTELQAEDLDTKVRLRLAGMGPPFHFLLWF